MEPSETTEASDTELSPEERQKNTPVTILAHELEELRNEAQDFKDKYWRLLAEGENARKRLQKEKQELTQFAIRNFLLELLPPVDHMEKALYFAEQMSGEVRNWAVGFEMILAQFKDVLANHNVKAFESLGKPFDPHFHEAVETLPTNEAAPGTVMEELVRGYLMGEQVLRPARVKVAKAPSPAAEPEELAEKEDKENRHE